MTVNSVLVVLIIITAFPVVVSVLLHGKYFKLVLPLAVFNIVIEIVAFLTLIETANRCRGLHYYNYSSVCTDHGGSYFWVSFVNLILGIIIWYLAFQKGENTPPTHIASTDMVVGSQLALQNERQEGVRKFLKASGWLVALGIIAFVVLIAVTFAIALSQL